MKQLKIEIDPEFEEFYKIWEDPNPPKFDMEFSCDTGFEQEEDHFFDTLEEERKKCRYVFDKMKMKMKEKN